MNLPPLIRLENVSVTLAENRALDCISWQLGAGEHWAVLGTNGSGKSTLLKLLRGDLWPDPSGVGRRVYHLDGAESASPVGLREHVALVSPELQERYLTQEWTLTGEQVVHTGFFHTDYLYQRLTPIQRARADAVMKHLKLEKLRCRNVQQMSQGELRKVLIARALVGKPRVLILDEFCDGLDAHSRQQLLAVIEQVARSGTQILYTTHRAEELIPAVTHVLEMKNGRIVQQGPRAHFPHSANRAASISELPHQSKTVSTITPALDAPALFELRNVSIYLERKRVLHGVNWRMNANENWTILGRNGAGKSTLLKVIAGDLHAAVGGEVRRFAEVPRTLWEVRRRLGFVSADFQANYREEQSGEEVIASGYFSSVGLVDAITPSQRRRVRELVKQFDLGAFARQSIRQMSYGQLRRILMARALVHEPQVLIFDEPFDGLDTESKLALQHSLEQLSARGIRLLLVTHHLNDLPACISHALVLADGRVISQGRLDDGAVKQKIAWLFAHAA